MCVHPQPIERWSPKISCDDGILSQPFGQNLCKSQLTKGHMSNPELSGGVGTSRMHDSARLHVTGEANYVDDLPVSALTLYAAIGVSQYANARVTTLDLDRVCRLSRGGWRSSRVRAMVAVGP